MYQVRAQPTHTGAAYGIPRAPAVPRELTSAPAVSSEPSSLPLLGSLLLLVTSYMLLLSVPLLSRKAGAWPLVDSHVAKLAPLLPAASGAGLALGGAAALVFVLMRLAREAEQRPYAALAPALAAFSGCIAVGLRASLPLGGVASEHVAVFALVVSVLGGSLAQGRGAMARMFGVLCTVLPMLSLLLVVWVATGSELRAPTWAALSAATRAYLTILSVSSVSICLLSLVARNVAAELPVHRYPTLITARPGRADDSFAEECAALKQRALPSLRALGMGLLSLSVAFGAYKLLQRRESAAPIPVVQVQSLPAAAPTAAAAMAVEASPLRELVVTSLAPSEAQPSAESLVVPTVIEAAQPAQPAPVEAVERVPAATVYAPIEIAAPIPRARIKRARPEPRVQEPTRAERRAARAEAAASKQRVSEPAPARSEPAREEPRAVRKEPAVETPRVARKEPAAPAVAEKPARSGDDSLDALMDGALRGKGRPAPAGQSEDPIFGL